MLRSGMGSRASRSTRNATRNPFVPNDYVDKDGFKLGLWVANRRKDYKVGRITPERVEALEAIPGWTWSLKDDAWEKGYERLAISSPDMAMAA